MNFNMKMMPKLCSSDPGLPQLSPEQVEFYWQHGYVVVKKLFDIPILNMFRNRFVEIANMPDASKFYSIVKDPKLYKPNVKPEMYINKIQELLFDDIYSKYSEAPSLLAIVSQLIGSDLTAVNCMLINKPPNTRRHPPHQDLYYFPFRPADKIIATWTAIDPVNSKNGCLYVIPGSHKVETLYEHGQENAEKKQFFYSLVHEEDLAEESRRVSLDMEPGDTVFFHPYIVHGSGPNESQHYRKAMTAHFAHSSCHYIDVRGTPHVPLALDMEREIRKRGGDFRFVDLWRMKSKQVKGTRANL